MDGVLVSNISLFVPEASNMTVKATLLKILAYSLRREERNHAFCYIKLKMETYTYELQ
jgi:hypothetical protein